MTQLPAAPARLWLEFTALFVGVPVLMAASFGLYPLFPVVLALAWLAAMLLRRTPGFTWARLMRGPVLGEWRLALVFALTVGAVSVAIVLALAPHRLLDFPRQRPEMWLVVLAAYPIASALPQEIIYRALFFERYGGLFPGRRSAILANGAAFGLGHLFFANPVTIAMTAIGGAIMAWAYLRNGAFGLAWLLHALAGQIIFTSGLGIYFYHGAIGATP